MKKIFIIAAVMLGLAACDNDHELVKTVTVNNDKATVTPASLLTANDKNWRLSPTDANCYISIDKTPSTTGPSEFKLTSAKFEADGTFTFIYDKGSISVLKVSGKAVFKNQYGKNVFVLHPSRAIITEAGKSAELDKNDLKEKYSTTYLWEKVSLKEMPNEDFLLLVDIDKHPMASAAKTGRIEQAWVSKFYARN